MESRIYYNGDIITMEEKLYAEAVFIKENKIKKVGSFQEVVKEKEKNTVLVDLKGHTLLPAFIDSHSHITALAATLRLINLQDCKSFQQMKEKIKNYIEQKKLKELDWVVGFGYDHNFLAEKMHPNRTVLDEVSTKYPIFITHASGHMGVCNTAALKLLEIDETIQNPPGGKIGREEDNKTPNGYLEETAMMQYTKKIPAPTEEEMLSLLQQAQKVYLSYGITTAQDGISKEAEVNLLKRAAENKNLILDIVSYIDLKNCPTLADENKLYLKQYSNHFKIGGYKVFLDGSPQGRTAWLSKPYENGEKGYPVYSSQEVKDFFETALKAETQILVHSNGDAACQQMLDCLEAAQKDIKTKQSIRPVMIHAQTVRINQLDQLKQLAVIPSYFVAHTYYWGDIHLKNLGVDRASKISPLHATVEKGILFTLHQDTPVIACNMLETIWCAVNRITKNGNLLGQEECISVEEALRGVTINAAYQYFEEEEKGSLKEGKLADMIILDRNPLKVDKNELKEIKIIETIKNGKSVYFNE